MYLSSAKGAELYFVIGGRKSCFPAGRFNEGMSAGKGFLGLAAMMETPCVVVNVQRGGPSTGLPTRTEQGDLLQVLFGRNGESPLPVLAPASPAECFDVAIEAFRIAHEADPEAKLFYNDYYKQLEEKDFIMREPAEPWVFMGDEEKDLADLGVVLGAQQCLHLFASMPDGASHRPRPGGTPAAEIPVPSRQAGQPGPAAEKSTAKARPAPKKKTSSNSFANTPELTDGRLRVHAIVWSSTAEKRMAVVNNRVIYEGDSVEDFVVVAIRPDDVVVREKEKGLWRVVFGRP